MSHYPLLGKVGNEVEIWIGLIQKYVILSKFSILVKIVVARVSSVRQFVGSGYLLRGIFIKVCLEYRSLWKFRW